MDSGEWTVENGQWTTDKGEWRMDSGQWTRENGQWRMKNGLVLFTCKAQLRSFTITSASLSGVCNAGADGKEV
ncbi:hypothetical protein [Pedobacter sp. BS3]|uniref:hypothetical protein n=1 Tax=Pedobacter sp. BS3 TaxID=2567937 RepID=UPI001659A972|nr:hypothetical protein [Pedobacter sp. BS3]